MPRRSMHRAGAVPMRILDLMQADGLTREHVASHLQVIGGLTIYLAGQVCSGGADEQMP